MSRISKWKLEKTKVKVVFRLQFQATHIPQTGWDKLFISFIPADTGKPTAKTTKANVRNGSCKWGDPIYETTRLLQDSKSKQYDEKLYKLVVSMGSSRVSNLGEATINLADYVDASKPTIATIPLHGCSFGTILHITVQLLTAKTGFREFEQQRELVEKGLQSGVDSHGDGASGRIPSSEGVTNYQTDKVSARIKFKADANELSSVEEESNVNEESADSANGFDGSSNTSGSLYAEKHDTSCSQELGNVKCTVSGDRYGLSHFQSPHSSKEDVSNHQSNAHELAMATEDNSRLRRSLELAESSLFNLNMEISSLQGVADELGAETQKLSHELAAEISSAQELARDVTSMKSECLKFKYDIDELKELKLLPRLEAQDNQMNRLVLNAQLQFLNGISVVEGKIRELQKMTIAPNDGDTKFIHLELEALLNFLLDFKLRNGEVTALLNALPSEREDPKKIREMTQFESGNGFGLDLCPPESILHHLSLSPPVSDAIKGQIFYLVRELDDAKVEKEALTRKMDQMECYYEDLISELEENQKRLLGELQLLRNEHSTCLYALSVSKTEVESLHQEMNQQMLRSVQERRDLEAINLELERRATTSESALRRARQNYPVAVEILQKDLELLSSQVTSMFDYNENLIKHALPSQPVSQVGSRERSAGGDILFKDLKRSVCMQENLYRKVEEELVEMYSISLNLDIYSKTLEESLFEADAYLKIMNGKMSELVEEVTSSTASQNQLMLRLQNAMHEIHTFDEFRLNSISQCSEMALQNQLLEDKLLSVSEENSLLVSELRSCQSKYAVCSVENAELLLQLKQESFENEKLVNEISHLKEESDRLVSSKENLEESINFVQEKLANLLFLYDDQSLNLESVDIKDALLQLEEVQHSATMKNCRLMEENRNLKSEKAFADVSFSAVRSEILLMKQKFKSGVQDIATKLDLSNALVDRLQAGIESVANKLYLSSEIEEKFAEQNEVLLADFALLEDQMQRLTCKNGHVAREISNLDSLKDELGRSKLEIAELRHDKQELSRKVNFLKEELKTLRDKLCDEKALTGALAAHLESEKSRFAHYVHQQNELMEEIKKESSYQASMESRLSDMHEYSLATDVQLIYISNNYKSVLDELQQKLAYSEVSLRDLQRRYRDSKSMLNRSLAGETKWRQEKDSLLASLESLKSELEVSEAQNKLLSESNNEIKNQLETSNGCLRDLQRRYHDSESILNRSLAGETKWRLEKDNLLASLESLRSDLEISEAQNKLLSESNNELMDHLKEREECLRDLQKRHHETESLLNRSLAGEDKWRRENDSLLVSLESSRSDLEVSEAQNKLLSDSNNEIKRKLTMIETHFSSDSNDQASEILRLQERIKGVEEEMSNLVLSKDELEVLAIVLKGKVDEQTAHITLLEGYREEVMMLRSRFNELSKKLGQQVLKTEEFKNLSIHLKDLKEKAEAECVAAREKRGNEVTSAAMHDSLRVAFLKEQYETKVQELKLKLSVSTKHGEEMLMRLQDAINDIENRKKSEAVCLKKNEELSTRLEALESELMSILSEKVEKTNAYDRTKAELECALLSLECCKEEKEKLLSEFESEKSDLCNELTLVKGQLEDLKSSKILEKHEQNGSSRNASPVYMKQDDSSDANNEHLGAQTLRSSIERLHEELEKMKNENMLFDIEHDMDPDFQATQREIMQLHKANEELRSMFPLFDEISSGGNALDRVLALEIELADALKVKNKSNNLFQSSFLKQHSNEEAVFKSFRDINELIKEMLELKERNTAVEAELREMHDRYSRLSLQFAEVEGERQKLRMTLKNVRASKR